MLHVRLLWVFAASGASGCPYLWKSLRRVTRVADPVSMRRQIRTAVLLIGAGPLACMEVISLRALLFLV